MESTKFENFFLTNKKLYFTLLQAMLNSIFIYFNL